MNYFIALLTVVNTYIGLHASIDYCLEVSIYPVTWCAKRLKPLFNPTMTTNQNRYFNALLSMFVFWRSFTELNRLHQDLTSTIGDARHHMVIVAAKILLSAEGFF